MLKDFRLKTNKPEVYLPIELSRGMFPPSPSVQEEMGKRLLLGVEQSRNPLAVEEVILILKPVTPIGVLSPRKHGDKSLSGIKNHNEITPTALLTPNKQSNGTYYVGFTKLCDCIV